MIDEKMVSRLAKTMGNSIITDLQDISVLKDDDGTYQLFNKYTIIRKDSQYEITGSSIIESLKFFTLKNAVAWCSFDRRVRVSDCKRIIQLDHNLAGIETSILQHQRMAKNAKDVEYELIYLAKLGEERLKRKQMTTEMNSYIQESKNWQLKRFSAKP